jgi:hypothetical protein
VGVAGPAWAATYSVADAKDSVSPTDIRSLKVDNGIQKLTVNVLHSGWELWGDRIYIDTRAFRSGPEYAATRVGAKTYLMQAGLDEKGWAEETVAWSCPGASITQDLYSSWVTYSIPTTCLSGGSKVAVHAESWTKSEVWDDAPGRRDTMTPWISRG